MSKQQPSYLPAMSIEQPGGVITTSTLFDTEVLGSGKERLARYTADDLRSLASDAVASVVSIDEDRSTWYHYFEHPDGSDKTVVHFQPVANGLKAQSSAQILALQALLGTNVLFIPQNANQFTGQERHKLLRGNLAPLGEQRLRIFEEAERQGQLDLGSLALAGYSFGASDAAISAALIAEKGIGTVDSLVCGEPANIVKRTPFGLARDFAGPKAAGGKELIASVLQSDVPALVDLWQATPGAKNTPFMKQDFAGFAKDMADVDNLLLAGALRFPTFRDDLMCGMLAMRPESKLVLHKDHDSVLTPEAAFTSLTHYARVAAAIGRISLNVVRTSSEPKTGHAVGDNPLFWAALVSLATGSHTN